MQPPRAVLLVAAAAAFLQLGRVQAQCLTLANTGFETPSLPEGSTTLLDAGWEVDSNDAVRVIHPTAVDAVEGELGG